jgi:competence protein ComEC
MKPRYAIALVAFLILTVSFDEPSYIIVSRDVTIKEEPNGDSPVKARAKKGDYLLVLSSEQQNGYFNVQVPNTDIKGWVYRTFVRRYEGVIPVSTEEVPIPSSPTTGKMIVRVLDVGAGLCVAIKLPEGKYIIYDAGNYRSGIATLNQLKDVIPLGSTIEQLIISHTDADHIRAASNIIKNYQVKKVVNTGFTRNFAGNEPEPTQSYKDFMSSIHDAPFEIENINLHEKDSIISTGVTNTYNDVKLVFLCGFNQPLQEWGLTDKGEKINSVSIVAKLIYKSTSILLCGDAVGRHREDNNPNALIATEKYLVENAGSLLKSDILIAPHHGGNNASSTAFISKVSPSVVIFSAGHDNNHPTQSAAERYLKSVNINNIYRTDRGDDEREVGKTCYEWDYGRINGCTDLEGDDDVEIVVDNAGKYNVRYVSENGSCKDLSNNEPL